MQSENIKDVLRRFEQGEKVKFSLKKLDEEGEEDQVADIVWKQIKDIGTYNLMMTVYEKPDFKFISQYNRALFQDDSDFEMYGRYKIIAKNVDQAFMRKFLIQMSQKYMIRSDYSSVIGCFVCHKAEVIGMCGAQHNCKTKYCSKACAKKHWDSGHKHE